MASSITTPHSVATQPGCGPDHSFTIRHSATNVHGTFTSICQYFSRGFIHLEPACKWGTTCGKADHPWQPYLSGGTIYGNIICRRWSRGTSCGGGPVVAGDQLWRDRSRTNSHGHYYIITFNMPTPRIT